MDMEGFFRKGRTVAVEVHYLKFETLHKGGVRDAFGDHDQSWLFVGRTPQEVLQRGGILMQAGVEEGIKVFLAFL
ncbi:MAG: hypothetical protein GX589_08415, partial [Deltaproteobacteria bacterium]|nr:hypothetical protein [Deltaproteobacteria bacterium]